MLAAKQQFLLGTAFHISRWQTHITGNILLSRRTITDRHSVSMTCAGQRRHSTTLGHYDIAPDGVWKMLARLQQKPTWNTHTPRVRFNDLAEPSNDLLRTVCTRLRTMPCCSTGDWITCRNLAVFGPSASFLFVRTRYTTPSARVMMPQSWALRCTNPCNRVVVYLPPAPRTAPPIR
ncbi:hypothetical protein BDU57DRAFT_522541 [Ampelomyces quisqualis]|uniref:Uncharacterized protein n=1 Tax=Ampelomyces quisqualis TaxID=50730 RepID=A0A6A5QBU8_AMPQU|nr:hypothetical protein BDU57DRAFT_522541 [Ampelomyces quisqualis]